MRIEPPVSDPSASSQRPAASAAPLPLDEPPVVLPGCAGLWHVPCHGFDADHAPRELGEMRLADEHGTGVEQPLDRGRRPLGDVVGIDLRAVRGTDAGRVEEILHGERAAGERPWPTLVRIDLRDECVPAVFGHSIAP